MAALFNKYLHKDVSVALFCEVRYKRSPLEILDLCFVAGLEIEIGSRFARHEVVTKLQKMIVKMSPDRNPGHGVTFYRASYAQRGVLILPPPSVRPVFLHRCALKRDGINRY